MPKPLIGSYPAAYENYIKVLPESSLENAFSSQQYLIDEFLPSISEEKSLYAYAPNKWTLREMLQHIIDTERIFTYRALCFARHESQSLPGFDENLYAEHSNANRRSWKQLMEEFQLVRKSSILMFDSFSEEMLDTIGKANNNSITVNAIGYITVGHLQHHVNIINERYLP